MATWKELLTDELESTGERYEDIVWAIQDGGIEKEFDAGYGGAEGVPFTAWGPAYVYFPVVYDGAEWVGSAPRNPCDTKLSHQGGQ